MKSYEDIPEIDLSPLWGNNPYGLEEVAAKIKGVYTTIGFAYLVNYNIHDKIFKTTYAAAKKFLTLPKEIKLKIKQNSAFRGYVPCDEPDENNNRHTNQLEAFVMTHEILESHPDYHGGKYLAGPNIWPDDMPEFQEAVIAYRDNMLNLAEKLVTVFSIALGLGHHGLDSFFIDPTYVLRLQHYPKQPAKIAKHIFGLAPHTDYGLFTILSQEHIAGLEVKNEQGQWLTVPCKPNTLVLNSGDVLKRWSNNTFKSTPHRVVNRTHHERNSIPFFFEPNMHAIIEVMPQYITEHCPAKYQPIKYGDYLIDRLSKDFGPLDKFGS